MTLRFETGRDDVLEFSRAYHAESPTYLRIRRRVRLMLPLCMLGLWALTTWHSGFNSTSTVIYLAVALLWFLFYPARYDRNVRKYSEKLIDEGSHKKNFGAYELTLTEQGIRSVGPSGESLYHWNSVDRVQLSDVYLFVFLNGGIGYPIPIAAIGAEQARAACDFMNQHIGQAAEV